MSQLKFFRKLGEVWVFDLTWLDRLGARQSIAGVGDLAANWYTVADVAVAGATNDHTGCTIVESAPGTEGDLQYKRTDVSQFTLGSSYKLEFVATIAGVAVKTPERGYIIVEVN